MKDDKFLKCIADENRRKILKFLGEGEKCVNEISEFTGIEQSLVSHHLKMLRDCGLVKTRQDGKKIIYSLSDDKIYNILKMIEKVANKIIEECE
ncbi:MAG: metalloregulator ArsR/SmtB family transcription factor [Candidatus Thermoplasmatota archaeon]